MNSRLKRNLAAVEYKDDDYETTTDVLKDLLPFLENDKKKLKECLLLTFDNLISHIISFELEQ